MREKYDKNKQTININAIKSAARDKPVTATNLLLIYISNKVVMLERWFINKQRLIVNYAVSFLFMARKEKCNEIKNCC